MRTNLQADRPAALAARLQMDPVQGGPARCSGRPRGFPNPFAGLQRLVAGLSEQRQLTKDVQDRAAALGGTRAAAQPARGVAGNSGSGGGSGDSAAADAPAALGDQQEGLHAQGSDGSCKATAAAGPGGVLEAKDPVQYSLHDLPARRLLAGGSPPQLAWVPLRVALSLLRALPQHFVLLQAAPQPPGQPKRRQPAQHGQQQAEQREPPKAEGSSTGGAGADTERGLFNARSCPGELDVWVIPVRC